MNKIFQDIKNEGPNMHFLLLKKDIGELESSFFI